jgi:hypothetical protein
MSTPAGEDEGVLPGRSRWALELSLALTPQEQQQQQQQQQLLLQQRPGGRLCASDAVRSH